jgi:dienelactone hydrolase
MNINGQLQELFMDVYEPFGDSMTSRPVVIFAFGGGFVQGSRNDWYVVEVCRHLARAGYVAISPDYRTGIDYSEILQLRHMRIFFRPMQDMRAVVQYLKADYSELGDHFRIDTNRIIIGGASAGAITALMVAYCDKPSEIAQMGNINALDALGGFYSTTGLYPQYSWRHAAVLNVAGALIDADWVEPGDVPHIAAHGDADQVVPYGVGSFSSLTAGLFNLEGSYVIDSVANARGVCSFLYTMEGHDHPSESMGIPYIMSVVYQLMLRMHAIANYRTFCCPLDLQLHPSDTARYNANHPDITIHSTLSNDNGNAQIQWCALPCNFSTSGTSVQFTPDSAWKHVAAFAYEGNCQDVALITLKEDENYSSAASFNITPYYCCSLFPQPARDWFYIRLNRVTQTNIDAEIYDLSGKTIMTFHEFCNNEGLVALHIPLLQAGVYFVKIADEHGTHQPKKLMVIK